MFEEMRLVTRSLWLVLRSGALFSGTAEWRRAWAKARWLTVRHLGVESVVLPFDGGKLIARTADYAIGCQVYVNGHFGRDEFQRAIALVREAGLFRGLPPVFVDVGANIGTHTLYALNMRLFSRVVSIEPEAENFEQLQQNLLINHYDTADAIRAALSSAPGTAQLALSTQNLGDHRVVRGTDAAQSAATESIQLVDFATVSQRLRLDTQVPTLFWIDTQGHEYEVLCGIGDELLRRSPFVIEYWPAQLARNGTRESLHALLGRVATRFVVLQDGRRISSAAELPELDAMLMRKREGADYVDLLCLGSGF